ncbi:MAG: hypothetical protein AAFX06_25850 [Planctomycetota bacterium]
MKNSHCESRSARGLKFRCARGLTLTELVVVLVILVALGGVAVTNLRSTAEQGSEIAAQTSVNEVRDAVMQYWSDCKYLYPAAPASDQRLLMGDLLVSPFAPEDDFDPQIALGWNGEYLQYDLRNTYTVDIANGFTTSYGTLTDFAVLDVYGRPMVIQEPTLANLAPDASYVLGDTREVRVVSAGQNGVLEIDEALFESQLTPANQGDDIYVSFTLR